MCDKEIKCEICGNVYNLNRYCKSEITKIMEKETVCHCCAYWLEKIALTDENTVVVNGKGYTIGDENSNSPFKGFGGREFNIEFFDGRKVTSHNLWYLGEIPERFRSYPELQDNARFIPKKKVMLEVNKIYNMDCLEGLKSLPDNSIDLVVTSPPYNMRTRIRNGEYTTREKSEHFSKKYAHFSDDLTIEEYYDFHKNVLTELLRVSKCVLWNYQIVTGSKSAVFKLIGDFSEQIKDIIIWEKVGQPAMHEQVLNSCYEFIVVFENDNKKGRCITNAQFKRGTMNNVLKGYKKNNNIKGHGACFPVELVKDLVNAFSKEGDVVLDPFMGSGTTAVGALECNRKYIGFEIISEYVNIANDRIQKLGLQETNCLW